MLLQSSGRIAAHMAECVGRHASLTCNCLVYAQVRAIEIVSGLGMG